MPHFQPAIALAALLVLLPYLGMAFASDRLQRGVQRMPLGAQILAPSLLSMAYVLVATAAGVFDPLWGGFYFLVPPGLAMASRFAPSDERRIWPQLAVLLLLGLAVDLRWLEGAWPPHLVLFNKIILLDAGIYAFVVLRPIEGTGFDLRLRLRDVATGLREFAIYFPIALGLGLALGFLHTHSVADRLTRLLLQLAGTWVFTFLFIAVPEELFFRGWIQNLLERRMSRTAALVLTSVLFGLSHFNRRAALFNWRYVLLATIAGFFYGRAWRRDRRVGASAITHAAVDAVWSVFLR